MAMKVLHPSVVADEKAVERFTKAMKLAAAAAAPERRQRLRCGQGPAVLLVREIDW